MKRYFSALLLAVLALVFISVLLSTVDSAELFTPKDIPGTDMHNNPDALRQISREESANVFDMMQDFIDLSDSIVINLKIKNLDDAMEDLEEYARLASRYDNLIINLDMDDSEIEEFRRNNKDQLEALKETVQDSELLEDLKTLQIQYRESGDSSKLYSVTYEIEALKKKMGINTARLENSTKKLTESSKKYEVETSRLEESSKTIHEIGSDDEPVSDLPSPELTPTPTPTPRQTATPTATPTAIRTLAPGESATPTATPTAIRTLAPGESATPTATPTAIRTLAPGESATPTATPTAIRTLAPGESATPTATPTAIRTLAPGESATPTPIPTAIRTLAPGESATPTPTPTAIPTATPTPAQLPRQESVTIELSSEIVYYGDMLNISGDVERVSDNKVIEIFIDSKKAGSTGVTAGGRYLYGYLINKIKAGKHTVYSKTGISYSDVLEFEVKSIPNRLNFDISDSKDESGDKNRYVCTGNLTAGGKPIAGAAISILSGDTKVAEAVTEDDGEFSANLTLKEGDNEIKVVFDDPSYPVEKTTSPEVNVHVPGTFSVEVILVALLFSVILGYAGYYILNRRKKLPKMPRIAMSKLRRETASEENGVEGEPESPDVVKPVSVNDSGIKKHYMDLLSDGGYSAGYHFILTILFEALAEKNTITYKKSMTVNEFLRRLPEGHDSEITSFVRLYEKLVYQGIYGKGDEWSVYHLFEEISGNHSLDDYLMKYAGDEWL